MADHFFKDVLLDLDCSYASLDYADDRQSAGKSLSPLKNDIHEFSAWKQIRRPIVKKDIDMDMVNAVKMDDACQIKQVFPGRGNRFAFAAQRVGPCVAGHHQKKTKVLSIDKTLNRIRTMDSRHASQQADKMAAGYNTKRHFRNSSLELHRDGEAILVEESFKNKQSDSYGDVGDLLRNTLGSFRTTSKALLLKNQNAHFLNYKDYSRQNDRNNSIKRTRHGLNRVSTLGDRRLKINNSETIIYEKSNSKALPEDDFVVVQPKIPLKVKDCFLFRSGTSRNSSTNDFLIWVPLGGKLTSQNASKKSRTSTLQNHFMTMNVKKQDHRINMKYGDHRIMGELGKNLAERHKDKGLASIVSRLDNLYKSVVNQRTEIMLSRDNSRNTKQKDCSKMGIVGIFKKHAARADLMTRKKIVNVFNRPK